MVKSGLVRERGIGRARVCLCVLVVLLLGAAAGWAQCGAAAEIFTDEQSVIITVASEKGEMVAIHLDQSPDVLKKVELPKGKLVVGNIQTYEGPKHTEKTDFTRSPMHIEFKNLKSSAAITTFGIFDKTAKTWIYLGDPKLSALGFEGKFEPGNPARLTVTRWPSGDPCICR
jgi:hypothetical protein